MNSISQLLKCQTPSYSVINNHLPTTLMLIAGLVSAAVSTAGSFKIINFGVEIAGRVIPNSLIALVSLALTGYALVKLHMKTQEEIEEQNYDVYVSSKT